MPTKMNRRKAISSIFLVAGAGAAAITGVKVGTLYKQPDLVWLSTQLPLIAELAETIIPLTDTPGAKAAGVAPFIVTMVNDCTPKKTQNKFLNGLKEVEQRAHATFQRSFTDCSPDERYSILEHFEQRDRPYKRLAGKISFRLFGYSFFSVLKRYTVMGYCNSMVGATRGLAYQHIPGRYQGCMPLQDGQKAWAIE
jgi:hypothetical protein